jgi:membrane protein YqaA with SNARE-associated domain
MVDITGLVIAVQSLGYAGALLSGFLGSSSLFIALFPSYLVVPVLATQLNPFAVGVLAGLGAGVGQFLHYYIGLGGRHAIPQKYKDKIDSWKGAWEGKINKYGLLFIFAFAATPLTPDDVLWITLGLIKYPKAKALAAAIAGKMVLNLFYAYAGFYGWNVVQSWV